MIVPLGQVFAFAGLLFLLGAFCAVARRNLIMIILGVEVMVNAASIAFVASSARWGGLEGQAFALFLLAVAATEVSVGLGLVIHSHQRKGSFDPERYNSLQ